MTKPRLYIHTPTGQIVEVDHAQLSRILSAADAAFKNLRRIEGKRYPLSDATAEKLGINLQYELEFGKLKD